MPKPKKLWLGRTLRGSVYDLNDSYELGTTKSGWYSRGGFTIGSRLRSFPAAILMDKKDRPKRGEVVPVIVTPIKNGFTFKVVRKGKG